jgi:hypothetical protein
VDRSWTKWVASLAVLTAAIVIVVAAVGGGDGARRGSEATSTVPPRPRLSKAAEQADVHVEGVSTDEVEALIQELCTSRDADALAARVVDLAVSDPDDLRALVEGAGGGAERYCPDVAAEHPELINDTYNATLALLAAGATTTVTPSG